MTPAAAAALTQARALPLLDKLLLMRVLCDGADFAELVDRDVLGLEGALNVCILDAREMAADADRALHGVDYLRSEVA